ncbi:hypothetical protein GobsT_54220 [Gemmata obscuriglobus]|uniref:Cytochrome c domain-containing protein n=1 Tax=Gemmata obscuriglobus TaxID=114 RepID=A0A2Z3GVZ9_9BACT|nr:hypothetical protein [Gemmata obscuriglobus]AWM36731.1 hypothetical protein C1280_06655 [Gemmata obscuriglobus]QEG30617.1 hypothetical protein GobsT_54220 [Gemmata obscuriglobus]VTS09941.1 Putative lipoprotein OS=Chitinophaga pinensis (strain ATCC 43595 / DSM 2588 / NCIB 11800 / UQM 2034) GN=Cpin_1884 PE=4 SV=1 [Gemmata obscuriglobus UQM 2246]
MQTRSRAQWAAVASFVAASLVAGGAIDGQDEKKDDKPVSPGAAAPSAVRRVAVTPLKERSPTGGPVMEVRLPGAEKRLVRGSVTQDIKIPERGVPAGEPTQRVSIGPDELYQDQKRYEEDLLKVGEFVDFSDRSRHKLAPKDAKQWRAVKTPVGRETQLPPYLGSPVLCEEDIQTLSERCLMIRDPAVVDDRRAKGTGAWSFGHLMTEMANEKATGIKPSDFVLRWLEHWERDQNVNGCRIDNRRDGIRALVIDPWQEASGGPGKPLDLAKAPFRLMAIINRLDLSSNAVLGVDRIGDGGAGEARLMFCALDTRKEKDLDKAPPALFTVIFEYGIKRKSLQGVKDWAESWYELRLHDPKTDAYKARLERLTEEFVRAGADPECPPNRSALAQLRTNEIALDLVASELGVELDRIDGLPRPLWELREFVVNTHDDGFLYQVTVKQTPRLALRGGAANPTGGQRLAEYVNVPANLDAILNERHRLPVQFPAGRPFVDGASITPLDFFWDAPGIKDPKARHLLSLATCSGCHAGEAFPRVNKPGATFTHLFPLTRVEGRAAEVSPFLSGKGADGKEFALPDPAGAKGPDGKVIERKFADLERRAYFLRDFVRYFLYYQLNRVPIQNVH